MFKAKINTMLSWCLYWLGDLSSRPMLRYDWAWMYPTYSALMRWSSALDKNNTVWHPPIPESAKNL